MAKRSIFMLPPVFPSIRAKRDLPAHANHRAVWKDPEQLADRAVEWVCSLGARLDELMPLTHEGRADGAGGKGEGRRHSLHAGRHSCGEEARRKLAWAAIVLLAAFVGLAALSVVGNHGGNLMELHRSLPWSRVLAAVSFVHRAPRPRRRALLRRRPWARRQRAWPKRRCRRECRRRECPCVFPVRWVGAAGRLRLVPLDPTATVPAPVRSEVRRWHDVDLPCEHILDRRFVRLYVGAVVMLVIGLVEDSYIPPAPFEVDIHLVADL